MAQQCLYVGSTILGFGTSVSFPYHSYVVNSPTSYTPWYKSSAGSYYRSGSSYNPINTSPPSSVTVQAGYYVASSIGGTQNIQVLLGTAYTLSVTSNDTSLGTVNTSGGTYLSGANITVTATPVNGGTSAKSGAFVSWSDGGAQSHTVTADADKTVTAVFAQSTWRLYAVSQNTSQGTVSTSGWTSGDYMAAGTSKPAVASPKTNYKWVSWLKDGVTDATLASASATLVSTNADRTYIATFASRLFTLAVNNQTGGASVSSNPAAGQVLEGTQVTVSATPLWNYTFANWSGAYSSTSNPFSFTMPSANVTLWANYTLRATIAFTVSQSGSAGAVIDLYRGGTLENGGSTFIETSVYQGVSYTLSLGAYDTSAYTFSGWFNGASLLSSATSYTFQFDSPGPRSYTAVFQTIPRAFIRATYSGVSSATVTLSYPGGSLSTQNPAFPVTLNGYVGTQYALGVSGWNTATHAFTGWFAGESCRSTDNPYTFTPSTTDDVDLTAKFAELQYYTATASVDDSNEAATAGNSVTLSSSSPMAGGKYLSGSTMTLTCSAVPGWTVTSITLVFSDSAYNKAYPVGDAPCPSVIEFLMTADVTITVTFVRPSYNIAIDYVFSSPEIGVYPDQSPYGTAAFVDDYGYAPGTGHDVVSPIPHGSGFIVLIQPNQGFISHGHIYFKAKSNPYGMVSVFWSNTHSAWYAVFTNITEDITVYPLFKTDLSLKISEDSPGLGTAKALYRLTNGSLYTAINANASTATTQSVLGGNRYIFEAIPSAGAFFYGWFDFTDTSFLFPNMDLGTYSEMAITKPTALVARFVNSAPVRYIGVLTEPIGTADSRLEAVGGSQIDKTTWQTFFNIDTSGDNDSDRYYTVTGSPYGTLSTSGIGSNLFLKWRRKRVYWDTEALPAPQWAEGEYEDFSTEETVVVPIVGHFKYKAVYSSDPPARFKLEYCDASNSSHGTFTIEPAGANRETVEGLRVAADFLPGRTVRAMAVPANGYSFAGWYTAPSGGVLVSTKREHAFVLEEATSLYALFAQDANAIYVWEGGTEAKMMRWRSKRYVSNVPFNPTCVRVCADGYPVTVNIYSCSSPDSPSPLYPTQSMILYDQNAKTLASARKEKYFEIEVLSRHPVSLAAFGTSMGGLAV